MKKILISCPYDDLKGLSKSLLKFANSADLIISDKEIIAIDDNNIYLKQETHPINTFDSAFIRYPYDLISPHVRSYKLREHTEFLKTLALMFVDVAINDIRKAHFIRNRFFSLKMARQCGLDTPESLYLNDKDNIVNFASQTFISKSLGNCYFSEKLSNSESFLKDILSFERDGEDQAYIYPPHLIKSEDKIKKNIELFSSCFLQNKINGQEYRIFLVEDELFIYQRENISKLDKSSANLVEVDKKFLKDNAKKIRNLRKKLELDYLCLDAIYNEKLYIIDVNPFGAFPHNGKSTKVTDCFAKLLLKIN